MRARSPDALAAAIRGAWTVWTSDPADQRRWSAANPAWGQCASTALIVQDHLGGELRIADVRTADGTAQGVHYWNTLPDGRELDLTRDQFRAGEVLDRAQPVPRPLDIARGRLPGQYHLLGLRTARRLHDDRRDDAGRPVSVKAVCRDAAGRVLICRNHRDEWELPGGRPRLGELFADAVVREVGEETGLTVAVDRLLGASTFEATPGAWVDLVAYRCTFAEADASTPRPSDEHAAIAFVDPAALSSRELPEVYRELSAG